MNRNEERSLTGAAPALVNSRHAVPVTAWASGPARAGGSGRCGNCHRRMSPREAQREIECLISNHLRVIERQY